MPTSPNPQPASAFTRSYNSFSGVDIKAVFGNKVLSEIQAISYSITREKAPIYTMGDANPRSFSRGKRGIAGTLIFVVFDRHTLLGSLKDIVFQSDIDELRPGYGATGQELGSPSGNDPSNTVEQAESPLTSPASDQALAHALYVDQLPPFDITLAAANEYGACATMRIFGVELLNEGYGVSVDDIVSEQQFTYVARAILPWTPMPSPNQIPIIQSSSSS